MATITSFSLPSTRPSIAPQHSFGYVARACSTISCQGSAATRITIFLFLVPKMLAQVLVGAVAEDGYDHSGLAAGSELAAEISRRRYIPTRGDAHPQPFAPRDLTDHAMGIFGSAPIIPVRQPWF